MKIIAVALLTFLFAFFVEEVPQQFIPVRKLAVEKHSGFTTDKLGNVYVYRYNDLIKYDLKTGNKYYYSNADFGNINYVDASNPLKLIVFYKDFQAILFMDKFLNPTSDPLYLYELDVFQPDLVCASNNNGFWVYDREVSSLLRFNHLKQIENKSVSLSQLLGDSLSPVFMMEHNNALYLCDENQGIHVFDTYATYIKTLPIRQVDQIQLLDDQLFYLVDNMVFSYNIRNFALDSIPLPVSSLRSYRVEQNELFVEQEEMIEIYQIQTLKKNK